MAENNNVPAVFAKSLKKVFVNKKNPALDSIALNGIDLRKLCKMLDSSQWPLET